MGLRKPPAALAGSIWLALLAAPAAAAPAGPLGEARLLLDINPGPASSGAYYLAPAGELALFLAHDGTGEPLSQRLFRTDGTAEGTFAVSPEGVGLFLPFPANDSRGFYASADEDGRIYTLWHSDGTVEGTREVAGGLLGLEFSGDSHAFLERRGRLVFAAGTEIPDSASYDSALWVSDGTPDGTRLLRDLWPGGHLGPQRFVRLGDDALFVSASDDTPAGPGGEGGGLWRTDGTTKGTSRVARFYDGEGSIRNLWVAAPYAYLVVERADQTLALWRTDGTKDGTLLLRDLGRRDYWNVLPLAPAGGRAFFFLDTDELPDAVWSSDGTPEGTVRVLQLPPTEGSPGGDAVYPGGAELFGESYFIADDGVHGLELWRSDGTAGGTRLAFETCPGACSTVALPFIRDLRDRLAVFVRSAGDGLSPWVTDGTPEGSVELVDACPGECSDLTGYYAWRDVGGLWLFWSRDVDGSSFLWQTDLTPEGTHQVAAFLSDTHFAEPFAPWLRAGDSVVFVVQDPDHGFEPWVVPFAPFQPPAPPGPWLTSETVPGFAVKVRISGGDGEPLPVRREAACIPETLCLSGAVPGRSEVFVRVVGPKPNGRLWPTIVKFTTSTVEVWIEQASTGEVEYYRLEGATPGVDELPGLFDREGFAP